MAATSGSLRMLKRCSTCAGCERPCVEEAATAGQPPLPPLDAWLLGLFALEDDPSGQLDYVAQFKPRDEPVDSWNRRVNQVMSA